jgi:hypothetical protein
MSPVAGRPPRLLGRCQETSRKGGGGTGDLDPKQAILGIEIQVDPSTRTGAQVDDERFGVVGAVCLVWAGQIDVGHIDLRVESDAHARRIRASVVQTMGMSRRLTFRSRSP